MNVAERIMETAEVVARDRYSVLLRARRQGQQVLLRRPSSELPSFEELARLEYGAGILRGLALPGVLKLHGVERIQGGLQLVLEDFGGGTLRELLDARRLSPREAIGMAVGVARTLGELHQAGIVFKAVCPTNILVNPETAEVKLVGFDIASRLTRDLPAAASVRQLESDLTYTSPEQTGRMNRVVDYRTDFYSLGVTLYEMLTGQVPFRAAEPLGVVHGHIAVAPVPPHVARPDVPRDISEVVLKLLAKNAEDRYQSAYGLVADLEACLAQLQPGAVDTGFSPGRYDVPATFRLAQKLYGREEEKATLVSAFERASSGTAECVFVSGYSGVGKSSLVNEIHKPIVRKGGSFESGKYDQLQNAPYSGLIQAFQGLIREWLSESEAGIQELKARLQEGLGVNGQLIIDVIPDVERILGPQPPVEPLGPTESRNRFNLVFLRFVGALAREQHPVAIFLDDLQWADLGSLGLIQLLLQEGAMRHLLIIGAYRDNEVHGAHPLALMLAELRKGTTRVSTIQLRPLGLEDVTAMVADTFDRSHDGEVKALGELTYRKTEGNPFFVNHFLTSLYDRRLLAFEPGSGQWRWSLEQISQEAITENVAQLMAEKIRGLPEVTRRVLQLAACIGNTFDLAVLARVSERSVQQTAAELWEAVQEGLVLPVGGAYKYVATGLAGAPEGDEARAQYRFQHDRVQEAAYTFIPEDERKQVHLRLGRLLLAGTPEEKLEARIFDIVNQLDLAVDLVTEPEERQRLARLNLVAGRRAMASSAYTVADRYLGIAVPLLPPDAFQSDYALAFELHRHVAECHYLLGRYDEAEALLERLLREGRSREDKHGICLLRVALFVSWGKHDRCHQTGLEALRELYGVDLELGPRLADLLQEEMKALKARLEGRRILELADLPEQKEPEVRACAELMFQVLGLSGYASPALFQLLSIKLLNFALERGPVPGSSLGFITYAMWSGAATGGWVTAHDLALVGLQLSERLDPTRMRAAAAHYYGYFVAPWRKPVRSVTPYVERSYGDYLETGMLFMSAVSSMQLITSREFQGDELTSLCEHSVQQLEFLRRVRQTDQAGILSATVRVLGLLSHGPEWVAQRPWLEEAHISEQLSHLFQGQVIIQVPFLKEACFQGDYTRALGYIQKAEPHLFLMFGCLQLEAEFYFYRSLVLTGLADQATPEQWAERKALIASTQDKLRAWAEHSPENLRGKYVLVEAELARIAGEDARAAELYDEAIEVAGAHGLIHQQALASELAGRFYRARGKKRFARVYLEEAQQEYRRWGALALASAMERRYPELGAKRERGQGGEGTGALDLTSVLKASQAISGEIVLESLLGTLMGTLLESAGAQRGVLLLEGEGSAAVEVRKGGTEGATLVVGEGTFRPEMADSVVRYVERSLQTVVLGDAAQTGSYQKDPYVVRVRPRSVLCMPVLKKKTRVAVLYLENNLVAEAFTPERCKVLELLAAQAAISLENARLYDTLENRVKARTQELRRSNEELSQALQRLKEAQQQLVVQEKLASLVTLTSGVAHEIKNPLNFVNNFAALSKELADELLEELDTHCGRLEPKVMKSLRELAQVLKQNVQRIQDHGKRADNIVRSMLEHSRAGTGAKVPVDLNALVSDYATLARQGLQAQEPELDVQVEVLTDDSVGMLELVPQDLGRVLLNLLNNAFYALKQKRKQDKGLVPTVRLETRGGKEAVELRIRDNGIGIPASVREKIYNPFFTTKPPGEGTGLGLSISYDIVVQGNGGAIRVDSEEGQYTEFIITLPRPRA